jgi:hypothetical protein
MSDCDDLAGQLANEVMEIETITARASSDLQVFREQKKPWNSG